MPTYEYRCDQCLGMFEIMQSMKDEAIKDCPKCKTKGKVRRLISKNVGIAFKGSGFYINDSKKIKSDTSKSSASTDTASVKKSEVKPKESKKKNKKNEKN